jgi:hypothetical protein
MRTRTCAPALLVGAALLTGCGQDKKQPDFPDLQPVKGTVKRDSNPVKGGVVRFVPDPDKPEFLINAEVGPDGTYTLTTVRTTDSQGERKPGAPPGTYKVTYMPSLGDQTAGGKMEPIELKAKVTVKSGDNDIPIELPKK